MDLISDLYEAALIGDKWPSVLESFGQNFNSKGALIFASTEAGLNWTGGGEAKAIMQDNIDLGWMAKNDRPEKAAKLNYEHFITDTDLYSIEEILDMPYYQEFLIPRGVGTFCATFVYGIEGDRCVFSLEGMASDTAARTAMPALNALRPHISRSVMLSSRLKLERAHAMTDALKAIGVPAAVINARGLIRSTNELFAPLIGSKIHDGKAGISLADSNADKLLQATLLKMAVSHSQARSIPLPATEIDRPRILHLIPIAGEARDLFSSASILMVLTGDNTASDIQAPLLQTLFDLTPAEAKLAKSLAAGRSLNEIALSSGLSIHTVRTQAKVTLSKTGMASQKELLMLLKDLSLGGGVTLKP